MAFSTDKITKKHILEAISEIDLDGVRTGRHSSTYNLVYNNKRHPPKYVLSLANKYATGTELRPDEFQGGQDTEAFKLFQEFGFEIIPKAKAAESKEEKQFVELLRKIGKESAINFFSLAFDLITKLKIGLDDQRITYGM